MKKKRSHGTSRGIELTDEVIEALAREAEAGYDLKKLRRRPGRPPIGSEAAEVFQVRLDPELYQALRARAKADGITPSEVVRRILRAHLGSNTTAMGRPKKRDRPA